MKAATEDSPSFITRAELAKETGFSVRYIQILEKRRVLPVYRFGCRCVRYDLCEALNALKAFRVGSKLEARKGAEK